MQLSHGKDAYQAVEAALEQGYKVPKDLQRKYNVTGKRFIQALQSSKHATTCKVSKQKHCHFNTALISKIHATITQNIQIGHVASEEAKQSVIKIETHEAYEQITSNTILVDDDKQPVSEMAFKEALYDAFNLQTT